jgi:hypothetical protein
VAYKRNAYRVFEGKSERKKPQEYSRHRWADNIKVDLRKVGWGYGLDSSCSG